MLIGRTDVEAETPILTLATSCRVDSLEKTLMLERIGGRKRRDNRRWDGWMASSTRWTWVWVDSRSWWWTGRPGVLQFMGSQTVGHDWATELNWTELNWKAICNRCSIECSFSWAGTSQERTRRERKGNMQVRKWSDSWDRSLLVLWKHLSSTF